MSPRLLLNIIGKLHPKLEQKNKTLTEYCPMDNFNLQSSYEFFFQNLLNQI